MDPKPSSNNTHTNEKVQPPPKWVDATATSSSSPASTSAETSLPPYSEHQQQPVGDVQLIASNVVFQPLALTPRRIGRAACCGYFALWIATSVAYLWLSLFVFPWTGPLAVPIFSASQQLLEFSPAWIDKVSFSDIQPVLSSDTFVHVFTKAPQLTESYAFPAVTLSLDSLCLMDATMKRGDGVSPPAVVPFFLQEGGDLYLNYTLDAEWSGELKLAVARIPMINGTLNSLLDGRLIALMIDDLARVHSYDHATRSGYIHFRADDAGHHVVHVIPKSRESHSAVSLGSITINAVTPAYDLSSAVMECQLGNGGSCDIMKHGRLAWKKWNKYEQYRVNSTNSPCNQLANKTEEGKWSGRHGKGHRLTGGYHGKRHGNHHDDDDDHKAKKHGKHHDDDDDDEHKWEHKSKKHHSKHHEDEDEEWKAADHHKSPISRHHSHSLHNKVYVVVSSPSFPLSVGGQSQGPQMSLPIYRVRGFWYWRVPLIVFFGTLKIWACVGMVLSLFFRYSLLQKTKCLRAKLRERLRERRSACRARWAAHLASSKWGCPFARKDIDVAVVNGATVHKVEERAPLLAFDV